MLSYKCHTMLSYDNTRHVVHAMLYYVMQSYGTTCYNDTICYAIPHAMLVYSTTCYIVMLCCTMLLHSILYYIMLCYDTTCYMSFYETVCYVVLCHAKVCYLLSAAALILEMISRLVWISWSERPGCASRWAAG